MTLLDLQSFLESMKKRSLKAVGSTEYRDHIVAMEVTKNIDTSNDTAKVSFVKGYKPWELLSTANVEFRGVTFEGLVVEIDEQDTITSYKIASPSILLTRNECDITFEDPTPVQAVIRTLVGDLFDVVYEEGDSSETYVNELSRGMTIMDILKDIAALMNTEVYVHGWEIRFGKPQTPTGNVITVSTDEVEISDSKIGGAELVTKIKGYFYDPKSEFDEISYERNVISSSIPLVDIYTADETDSEGVKSYNDLVKFIDQKADEVRSRLSSVRIKLLKPYNVAPLDTLDISGKSYGVLSVTYRFDRGHYEIEVRAYEKL